MYNMNELIDEAIEPLSYRLEKEELTLEKQYDDSLPETQLDRDTMLPIMMNLLDNAIKYSPEQGTVTVGTSHEGGTIKVWGKDEGKGIEKANADKIFERFFQELWDENKPPGTGLGLAITRQLVEEHGGDIWAESPEGEGAPVRRALARVVYRLRQQPTRGFGILRTIGGALIRLNIRDSTSNRLKRSRLRSRSPYPRCCHPVFV